ncbi:GMC family oxidoreductase [Inquilinus limosus]|uniref:FAD-dependent oxidoreductase n=1 Tax=Inquilinus limosus TaxID=171674 RepID=UPI003F138179
MPERYDIIIAGSGAGGSAAAYKLVLAGKRVLLLEKGHRLPRDGSTLDVAQVFAQGRFKNREPWRDGRGGTFVPGEYYNVGGKTKWYGAALLRFDRHEFEADHDHQCLSWPFGYEELAPYYDQAEALLHVNRFPNEPGVQALLDKVVNGDMRWRPAPLPLGLKPEILRDEAEAKHFDGFASVAGYKSDAEINLLGRIANAPNFTLLTKKKAVGLLHSDPHRVEGVVCADGSSYAADTVVLAAGALTSPRILQDHIAATGLSHLPSAPLVGANIKIHVNTALLAVSPFAHRDVLRKTAILFNDDFPHSTVQCLGWMDGEILATQLPGAVPQFVNNAIGARTIGFFVTTEDGSSPENRVVSGGGEQMPTLDYELRRLAPAHDEHHAVVRAFSRRLHAAGMATADRYLGIAGTAHALGSMVTGVDPRRSVVDPHGRVHGMTGLYVADGSVLPRSSRVNPALTIYAWGLRLGDHLAGQTAGAPEPTP